MNRARWTFIILVLFLLIDWSEYDSSGPMAFAENFTIASFSTSIDGQDDNVKRNIMIACRKLNGTVLSPNSVFSFNAVVGEGSAQNGFVPGRVLYRDRVAMEPGGGLCQVSSTLYNALLMAGCTIIERHRHSQPVSYVPMGLDATIKYGKKDLRIRNTYHYALKIEMTAGDSSIAVKVMAGQKMPYRYEIYTEEDVQAVPVSEDTERVRQGVSVFVYRKRYQEDKLVENMLLYKDYYPPVYER
ncbi:MAG TPA: VanW family protein [Spirochaetota bacterium]|nr:VanW family protein [Spirochaetota bacterium]HPC39544.1 VanW family protein [Spirochaetota bacterium]HPL15262.1 VanW family protein [Spirochaetota bacterium]HQF06881.1 VanW family protein [Spirochaetota bacterium]HQH95500.1 VanW family protein [Spirochaetota bacterium]